MDKKKLITASGRPYYEFDNSMTVGNRGPILLQDYFLHEDMDTSTGNGFPKESFTQKDWELLLTKRK